MDMEKLKYLSVFIKYICAVLMVVITASTFIQVVRRYIFESVFRWPEELAIYSMIWVAFLGAVLCLKDNGHVRIDAVINLLPAKVKKWVEVFGLLMCFGFMMLLAYNAPAMLTTAGTILTPAMRIPMYLVYGSVLVSAILMVPYFAVLIWTKIKEGAPVPQPVVAPPVDVQDDTKGENS
ncbi:MAG: TRAP transporter small permease [Oscillospiraceae bacterium]|nr:TRAP transporter small permease [Oscillospiraceae bacterium]